jgi:hypothetical protein
MEGLAFVAGIGGGILLILLAVWAIKSIWHPKHKRRTNLSEIPNSIAPGSTLQV